MRYLFIIIAFSITYTQHFNVEIEETGESTLFIFQNTILSLQIGDELGLFDENGIIDSNGNVGELLVGSGIWNGEQLNIVAISSQDLSQFGGPVLPGYVLGNTMKLKIWSQFSDVESVVDYIFLSGNGTFNGLFSVINEIECENIDICGFCEGSGAVYECGCNNIEEGECDCDGNILDCIGVCGGASVLDECGVCNGPGEIYECGCSDIEEDACDCDGNIDLGCGCGIEGPSGCDNTCGSTLEYDECGECGGSGPNPGYDCLDNCIIAEDCFGICGGSAILDECGVCDGSGATFYCDWPYYIYVCSENDCFGDGGTGGSTGGTDGGGGFDGEIDYSSEIQPIFEINCTECHSYGGGYAGGLDLGSYTNLMEGGYSGDVVWPYYSSASLLIQKLNGTPAAGDQMPLNAEPLTGEIIELIANWIDQGAIGPDDDDNDGGGCDEGQILDCDGNCFDENLLENGICNEGINGQPNFNCSALFYDGNCVDNFENCSPDCPVGILDFGDINVDLVNDSLLGQMEIIMNCEFDVTEFEILLSEGINILELTNGTAIDNNFDINYTDSFIQGNGNDIPLNSGEQVIITIGFETNQSKICFDSSLITTTLGIEYSAVLGGCISLDAYSEGWNWISLNKSFEDMSLDSILSSIDGNAEFIKNQSVYANYYDTFGWFGTLETINNVSMYKLNMINNDGIAFKGEEVNVNETILNLLSGWNWISYVPQNPLNLSLALSNIPDGSADFIKNQSAYANYYDTFGWFGTLDTMYPLDGYVIKMLQNEEFTYSEGNLALLSPTIIDIPNDMFNLNIHDYEYNATITTALYVDDIRVDSNDYTLVAYDGLACVGYTKGLYFPFDGNVVFPLMVYGNEEGLNLTFKVYNNLTDIYLDIVEEVVFVPDMNLGDGFNPFEVHALENPNNYVISAAYPNPFNPVVNFDLSLDGTHYVQVKAYNLSGQQVAIIHDGMLSGNNKINWMAIDQTSGIYFIQVSIDGKLAANNKVILLK